MTTPEIIDAAVAAGADALGVMHYEKSPRHVEAEKLPEIVDHIHAASAKHGRNVQAVLVVYGMEVTAATQLSIAVGAHALQLHGSYTRDDFEAARGVAGQRLELWRAVSLSDFPEAYAGEFGEDRLLLDAPVPGAGKPWDTQLLRGRDRGSFLLAGGLTPDNVATVIADADPEGVDVSSGVEAQRGVKDPRLVRTFIERARAASAATDQPAAGKPVTEQ